MPLRLLHLDCSIDYVGDSVSRLLSREIVERLASLHPGLKVAYRDLVADPLSHLSGSLYAALKGEVPVAGSALAQDCARSAEVLEEFQEADILVIGVPYYNFSAPSQLKAWVDRVFLPEKTIRHCDDGSILGLAGDKRVILAATRGICFGPGSGFETDEHAVSFLQSIFRLMGTRKCEVIVAEGLRHGPAAREAGMSSARKQIRELVA